MKTNEELIGKEARLPHGQKVVIEEVDDGYATVRRTRKASEPGRSLFARLTA